MKWAIAATNGLSTQKFLANLTFVTTLMTTACACQAKESSASSPYPIYDSAAVTTSSSVVHIYWIDNERVLFEGVKDNNKRFANSGPYNLSIWTIGKPVAPYTPYANRVAACVSEGTLYYKLEDAPGGVRAMYGKFGEEKPIKFPQKSHLDVANCKIHDLNELRAQHGNRTIVFLLARHGYLDYGARLGPESSINNNVLLYRSNQKEPITLPLKRSELRGPTYYAFKDAYYVANFGAYGRTGQPVTTWWLYPDGRVEEVKIPIGPWAEGVSGFAFPTRQGIFISYNGHKSVKDPGPAGGYLVQGNKFTKVISGAIHDAAVSPDGCKVAFSHAPYTAAAYVADPARFTLKMINFCLKENNNG